MKTRRCWFIELEDERIPGFAGRGEVAPLEGLSEESSEQVEQQLMYLQEWSRMATLADDELPDLCSSVRFGFEMAKAELGLRQRGIFFESPLLHGVPLPVNGLVWMSDGAGMKRQALEKVREGYSCIKFKVGGISFDEELDVLDWVRDQDWGRDLTIRLDANGAFGEHDVFDKLRRLSAYGIHSIEQPVRSGQQDLMRRVCQDSPIPVAIDEELIGVHGAAKTQLIKTLKPAWLVIKPSLHGGFSGAREWIRIAEHDGAGWWITSSLESPLGLSALAQFTSASNPLIPQGLGTGKIYSDAPRGNTSVRHGSLFLD